MDAKSALNQIKILLGAVKARQKFDVVTLTDGTSLEVSALEVGATISIPDAQGAMQPATPGEYTLEDGRVIIVTETGLIDQIESVPAAAEQLQEAGTFDQATIDAINTRLNDLEARISVLEKNEDAFSSVLTSMHAFMSHVAKEPSEAPVTTPKQTVFSETQETRSRVFANAQAAFAAFSKSKAGK